MIPKTGKATGKNCNMWNIKPSSWNQQSLNLKEIHNFEIQGSSEETHFESEFLYQMSRLSLENINGDLEPFKAERQVHGTLLLKDKADVFGMLDGFLKRK